MLKQKWIDNLFYEIITMCAVIGAKICLVIPLQWNITFTVSRYSRPIAQNPFSQRLQPIQFCNARNGILQRQRMTTEEWNSAKLRYTEQYFLFRSGFWTPENPHLVHRNLMFALAYSEIKFCNLIYFKAIERWISTCDSCNLNVFNTFF